ncbi:MAG TPA: hypothetical protein P5121_35175 [Caldilineaceae bacterium]|nr:hypothetical protein [Caldilineaceae bacterium]
MNYSTTKVSELAQQFNDFNEELLDFVQSCDSASWSKVMAAEGWPVGSTARHIAVAHYF